MAHFIPASVDSPLAPKDVRWLLGALEHGSKLLGETDEYVPDTPATNRFGWRSYKHVMSCDRCPMCLLHTSGVCGATCVLGLGSITTYGAPCSHGIRDDGAGLMASDFDEREQLIKIGAKTGAHFNPNAIELSTPAPRFKSRYSITSRELAERGLIHPDRLSAVSSLNAPGKDE